MIYLFYYALIALSFNVLIISNPQRFSMFTMQLALRLSMYNWLGKIVYLLWQFVGSFITFPSRLVDYVLEMNVKPEFTQFQEELYKQLKEALNESRKDEK